MENEAGIDMARVVFTRHAIKRFEERFAKINKGIRPKKTEKTARRLLALAKEEVLDPVAKVKRIINNSFEEARYFSYDGWRFVMIEDGGGFIVKTIERDF